MDRRAEAPVVREPTSFEYNWLGCYNLSVCAHGCRSIITLQERPGSTVFFLRSTRLYRTIMPLGWCLCALFIGVVIYISGSVPPLRRHTTFPRGAHHIYTHLDWLSFSEYSGIYWWNLRISLVYFWISPLYIVKSVKSLIFDWFPLLNLCVQVNAVLASGEKRKGSLFHICFLKQSVICLFIRIVHQFEIQFLWSEFWIYI